MLFDCECKIYASCKGLIVFILRSVSHASKFGAIKVQYDEYIADEL